MRIQSLFSAALFLLMAGCATDPAPTGEANPFNSVQAGSTLVLNRELRILPDQVATYVQYGEVMAARDVDMYKPNCKFELYSISENERRVQPDTFTVIRVLDQMEQVSANNRVYAGLGVSFSIGSDTGPVWYNYTTQLFLDSGVQPDVYRMTCQHLEESWRNRYLSIAQMREAMGDVFSLELAAPVE